MDLVKMKKFSDRVVSEDLTLLAARETHSEFIKDIKLEMKKNQNFTPAEIRMVMRAAKIEITPVEKMAASKEIEEGAQAIVDTRRPNADQKVLA